MQRRATSLLHSKPDASATAATSDAWATYAQAAHAQTAHACASYAEAYAQADPSAPDPGSNAGPDSTSRVQAPDAMRGVSSRQCR